MKDNTNNVRGFTLVELLAVIVVLAIVMLIALQAVLPSMERARRQTFAIEANGAIDAANTYFMSSWLTGGKGFPATEGGTNCVTIAYLYQEGYTELGSNYSGKVVVQKRGNIHLYYVFLQKDNSWMVYGAGTDIDYGGTYNGTYNVDINENDVEDYRAVAGFDVCETTGGGTGTETGS